MEMMKTRTKLPTLLAIAVLAAGLVSAPSLASPAVAATISPQVVTTTAGGNFSFTATSTRAGNPGLGDLIAYAAPASTWGPEVSFTSATLTLPDGRLATCAIESSLIVCRLNAGSGTDPIPPGTIFIVNGRVADTAPAGTTYVPRDHNNANAHIVFGSLDGPNDTATYPNITVIADDPPLVPSVSILKTGALIDANGNGLADPNETVDYSFTVANTGEVDLSQIRVTDAMTGSVTCQTAALRPTETTNCATAAITVTQAHLNAGEIINTATVTATTTTADTVTDEATHTLNLGPTTGAVTFNKAATLADSNNNGLADIGEDISYTFSTKNTGRVTLSDLAITDKMIGAVTCNTTTLSPNETANCIGNPYQVTANDPPNKLTNTATLTARTPNGDLVTATATHTINTPAPTTATTPTLASTGLDLTTALGASALAVLAGLITIITRRRHPYAP